MRTFVISEAGSCHDGSILRACDLIFAAQKAGADACKFQYWSSAERLAERRNATDYLEVYRKYGFAWPWLNSLKLLCDERGIEFMCTVYLTEDIPVIAPYVKRFKVASFEAGDHEFIKAHWPYKKPIIVSTGMMRGSDTITVGGCHYLHCVSAYPTPLDQANLGVLHDEWDGCGWYEGYSDHTHDVLTGALAVAAGARILEVHFRLDDTDPANPDYATALSPGQLKDYISLVRKAELMMGDGIKRPQPAEEAMMRYRVKP